MYRNILSGAAVLLALAPQAISAAGVAHIYNNCTFPVWFASIAQSETNPMALVPALGYAEQYSKPNVGISLKMAALATGPVTQFEYTWNSPDVSYDISNIDGNPFWEQGMTLVPSVPASAKYPTCKPVSCPAGVSYCVDAYNEPNAIKTMVCGENTDLVMTICPSTFPSESGSSKEKRDGGVHRHHARHLPKLW